MNWLTDFDETDVKAETCDISSSVSILSEGSTQRFEAAKDFAVKHSLLLKPCFLKVSCLVINAEAFLSLWLFGYHRQQSKPGESMKTVIKPELWGLNTPSSLPFCFCPPSALQSINDCMSLGFNCSFVTNAPSLVWMSARWFMSLSECRYSLLLLKHSFRQAFEKRKVNKQTKIGFLCAVQLRYYALLT